MVRAPALTPAMDTAESLGQLRLSELQKKARASGIPSDQVDDAADADNPKAELIGLILAALEASGAALRAELGELKLGSLQKRARAAGADGDSVDDAADADDPKAELIAMIVALHQVAQPSASGGGAAIALSPLPSPTPSSAATPTPGSAAPEHASGTPLSLAGGSPMSTLTRQPSYGAEALREAGHAVLHQHHLEDTMGACAGCRAPRPQQWRQHFCA